MNTFSKRVATGILVLCFAVGAARSAEAIEIVYVEAANVTTSGFTVFWQATEAATPFMSVYSDPGGLLDVTDSVRVEFYPMTLGDVTLPHDYAERSDRRDLEASLRENGLFLARVSHCEPGTEYFIRAGARNAGDALAEGPGEGLFAVRTAARTGFVFESLQVMIEFPEGGADGMVATLNTPAAAYPLVWAIGDSGFSNRAFFNLSDLIDPETNSNLQVTGALPLVIRLHRPGGIFEGDDEKSLTFSDTFVVAKVTDLIFSGTESPQVVHGFAISLIGTQTAGVPFRVTIRALDLAGNPLTEFTGVAELSSDGELLHGSGATHAFTNGVLADHLVSLADPGQHYLEVSIPGGGANSLSNSFRVTGSFDRWLLTQFPDPDDRSNPLLSGRGADPSGTGVANLLAYAVGTGSSNPDRSRLPQPVIHNMENASEDLDGTHLAITYARSKGATDVVFIPEVSEDLVTWHAGPAFTEEVEVLDHGHYELVTARDLVSFDGEGRRFMRLRVRSGESFAAWQARHFTGERFFEAAWSSTEATPAGDGISNLMKYALGLDPHAADRTRLPNISTVNIGDERFLIMVYERPIGLPDVDYVVEVSNDLINWNSGSEYTDIIFVIDNPTAELIVERDLLPLGEDERRFIRLRVVRR